MCCCILWCCMLAVRVLVIPLLRCQVLEACVKNCGQRFHAELGKFRFLNEVIRMLSPKVCAAHDTVADGCSEVEADVVVNVLCSVCVRTCAGKSVVTRCQCMVSVALGLPKTYSPSRPHAYVLHMPRLSHTSCPPALHAHPTTPCHLCSPHASVPPPHCSTSETRHLLL